MTVRFYKAHGAGNDFLITWAEDVPAGGRPELARAICARHTGVGADGWYVVERPGDGVDARVHLYNSDGSEAELSGNGTRCVAAVLCRLGLAGEELRIETGAGLRTLRLLGRSGETFRFEMAMGEPVIRDEDVDVELALSRGLCRATILDVGNPQCAVFVGRFPDDWREIGAEIERHPRFPNRTNVSFVRVIGRHAVDARFFERGAGETLSSGTGAVGAAVAAIVRGEAESPVTVRTPAGELDVRWDEEVRLTGPATVVASGEFFYSQGGG